MLILYILIVFVDYSSLDCTVVLYTNTSIICVTTRHFFDSAASTYRSVCFCIYFAHAEIDLIDRHCQDASLTVTSGHAETIIIAILHGVNAESQQRCMMQPCRLKYFVTPDVA